MIHDCEVFAETGWCRHQSKLVEEAFDRIIAAELQAVLNELRDQLREQFLPHWQRVVDEVTRGLRALHALGFDPPAGPSGEDA